MKKLCIYHANCTDGFTAAWVVWKSLGDTVEFFEGRYGNPPPDVTGRDVILVDFSYKRPVLEEMASKANTILILDHHKTAEEDLSGLTLPNITVLFDMERSGAGIAWDWFNDGASRPDLVRFVEDRDLWRFQYSETRAFLAYLGSFEQDFTTWDIIRESTLREAIIQGEAIDRAHLKSVNQEIGITKRRAVIGGYDVPLANVPVWHASDTGNIMAQGEKFAVTYCDTARDRLFSLRSTDKGMDVGEIAKLYGGGGHRNAAGFKVPRDHELARI